MSIKLTDTQLVILSAAAQRKDRCLVASPTLKGGAAQRVANKLISSGLVKEVKAKTDDPVWRRDEESGAPYALKLTAAGAKAIVADEGAEPENAEPTSAEATSSCPPLRPAVADRSDFAVRKPKNRWPFQLVPVIGRAALF
jgi:hypothetical protein